MNGNDEMDILIRTIYLYAFAQMVNGGSSFSSSSDSTIATQNFQFVDQLTVPACAYARNVSQFENQRNKFVKIGFSFALIYRTEFIYIFPVDNFCYDYDGL